LYSPILAKRNFPATDFANGVCELPFHVRFKPAENMAGLHTYPNSQKVIGFPFAAMDGQKLL